MRGVTMALLLMLGAVSAVSGSVAAYATWGKGASACSFESSEDDEDGQVMFQRATLKHARRPLPVR